MGKYSLVLTKIAREDIRSCNKESIKKIVINIVHILH